MVVLKILHRYVFKEITVAFLFCFAVFVAAGLIAGFLPLLQKGLEAGMGLTLILFQVLINAAPSTLVTVLPLSLMIGVLLGLGRMSADNEIAAIKSAGISVARLFPAVVFLAIVGFCMSLACTLVLIPKGTAEGRLLMQEALTSRVDAAIEQRQFFDKLKNLILYVENVDPVNGVMNRIFIRESTNPDETSVIIAKEGKSVPDPEGKAFILNLRNGTILKEDKQGDTVAALAFDTYVFRYPLAETNLENTTKPLEEMNISGIRRRVREITAGSETATPEVQAYHDRVRTHARIVITQRFTHPLACLALAMTAFPLGILNIARSRLNNVSVGLLVMFLYYALTLATERVARSGLASPELVMPLPAVFFGVATVYFIRCVQSEQVPAIIRWARELILRLRLRHG